MEELVFCCSSCLTISSTGAFVDPRVVSDRQGQSLTCACKTCKTSSTFALSETMMSSSLADGHFTSMGLPVLGGERRRA